jgi:hypothetical protein
MQAGQVKIKLSKDYTMKEYGGVDVSLHHIEGEKPQAPIE